MRWLTLGMLLGEGTPNPGGGGSGGSGGDSGTDGPPPADGPFACGSETCSPTQYCIHPCCGGAPPLCQDKPDGGGCPRGFHEGCSGGVGVGSCTGPDCCEADPCQPPPPYCADSPESGCDPQQRDCVLLCA
jgi:hypothetical protein